MAGAKDDRRSTAAFMGGLRDRGELGGVWGWVRALCGLDRTSSVEAVCEQAKVEESVTLRTIVNRHLRQSLKKPRSS